MRLIFLATCLFIFSSLAQAKTCRLVEDFRPEALNVLRKAEALQFDDLVGRTSGFKEYDVDIVHNDRTEQYLVFLGEIHIKKRQSALMGKKVLSEFRVRFLEGVPERETKELKSILGWQRILAKVLSLRLHGSTITQARKQGLAIGIGDEKVVRFKKKKVKEFNNTPVWSSDDVVSVVNGVDTLLASQELNLPLEVGSFLQPEVTDNYIITQRNKRMVANIGDYLMKLPLEETPLIVVGSAHNSGLIELLQEEGFEECTNF